MPSPRLARGVWPCRARIRPRLNQHVAPTPTTRRSAKRQSHQAGRPTPTRRRGAPTGAAVQGQAPWRFYTTLSSQPVLIRRASRTSDAEDDDAQRPQQGPERATATASRPARGGRAPPAPQCSVLARRSRRRRSGRSSDRVSALYAASPARRRDDGHLQRGPTRRRPDRLQRKPASRRGAQRRLAELRRLRCADSQRTRGALAGARRGVDHVSPGSTGGSGGEAQEHRSRRFHSAQPVSRFGQPGGCECVEPSGQARWRDRRQAAAVHRPVQEQPCHDAGVWRAMRRRHGRERRSRHASEPARKHGSVAGGVTILAPLFLIEKGLLMRRASGIVSLTGIVVVIALATPFDSPYGLAQSKPASNGTSRAAAKPYTTWQSYAGGAHSSQYSALDQINTKNVAKLEVAWSFPITGGSIFNPVVIDGVMYAPVGGGALAAIDAATGKEIWRKEGMAPSGARGMNYWESPDRSDRRFIYLQRGDVIAVNAQNGEPITSFGNNGRVDLRDAMERKPAGPVGTSNPGRIFENLFIQPLPGGANYGGPPADVHAYDVRTGKLAWIFHVIPHEGEFGYDTWPAGHYKVGGGVHNWSEFTVDEENGIAFIGFGTARYDFYGGDRKGNNLYANSLVAIDARTGKRIWHQQLIHHDLWTGTFRSRPSC